MTLTLSKEVFYSCTTDWTEIYGLYIKFTWAKQASYSSSEIRVFQVAFTCNIILIKHTQTLEIWLCGHIKNASKVYRFLNGITVCVAMATMSHFLLHFFCLVLEEFTVVFFRLVTFAWQLVFIQGTLFLILKDYINNFLRYLKISATWKLISRFCSILRIL